MFYKWKIYSDLMYLSLILQTLKKPKSHEKCKAFCARHHGKRGHERSEPVGAWGYKAIDKKGG